MAGREGNPFHNIIWLATSTDGPNTQRPIIDNIYQSQPYQPHTRYLPNERDALHAHMHKVHKLSNAQIDTSYYTYYQNKIKNKSAHIKISNAFWSTPAISHKEKDTDDPNTHPIIDNGNQSQPYQPHVRYSPTNATRYKHTCTCIRSTN